MAVKNNEQGSTMIETILYICVLIALGTIIAQGASRVFARYNLGRTAQQVIDLKKTILMYTAADEDYTALSNNNLKQANAIPLDMKNFTHALGGQITIGCAKDYHDAKENAVANKYMYFITFDQLDRPSCTEILSQGQFFTDGSELDTLIVNSKVWGYEFSLFAFNGARPINPIHKQHLSVEQSFYACDKKKNNTITWIFS